MSKVKATLFAGAAVLAVVGLPQLAVAAEAPHVLTVQLPDGEIARIQYVGDVAPQVVVAPAPIQALMPVADPFGSGGPFAALEAMSARMDQEMAGLMHQVESLAAQPAAPGLTEAAFGQLPAGMTAYSMVQTIGPNGVCTRTTRITGVPGAVKPQTVSQVSGDCGGAATPTALPAPNQARPEHTIEVKDLVPQQARPTWRG